MPKPCFIVHRTTAGIFSQVGDMLKSEEHAADIFGNVECKGGEGDCSIVPFSTIRSRKIAADKPRPKRKPKAKKPPA